MTGFNFLTRRRLLWAADATAEVVALKGCTLTPPSPSAPSSKVKELALLLTEIIHIKSESGAIAESAPSIALSLKWHKQKFHQSRPLELKSFSICGV